MHRQVAARRKERELDPLLRVLEEVLDLDADPGADPDSVRSFRKVVGDIRDLARKADRMLGAVVRTETSGILGSLLKVLRR